MKSSDHIQNISKVTFENLDCFKHVSISSYLLVTLHLPQALRDGEASKDDKMGSTYSNLNMLYVMDST